VWVFEVTRVNNFGVNTVKGAWRGLSIGEHTTNG
jgi:hypothetical protein